MSGFVVELDMGHLTIYAFRGTLSAVVLLIVESKVRSESLLTTAAVATAVGFAYFLINSGIGLLRFGVPPTSPLPIFVYAIESALGIALARILARFATTWIIQKRKNRTGKRSW